MATWSDAKLTEKGRALQEKLTAGEILTITKVLTGAGKVSVPELHKQTEVAQPRQSINLEPVEMLDEGKAKLPVLLTNHGVAEAYTAHQIGVYASDPDKGEILYCIVQDEDGEWIPAADMADNFTVSWELEVGYGNASGINIRFGDDLWMTYPTATAMFLQKTELEEEKDKMLEAIKTIQPAVLTGTEDPDTATPGKTGQFYVNTETGKLFVCQEMAGESFIWREAGTEPLFPQIIVSAPIGTLVTCSDGKTILSEMAAGEVTFHIPRYGNWTIQAKRQEEVTRQQVIQVDAARRYKATLAFPAATLIIAAAAGAAVTAVYGAARYTGTCGADGTCSLEIDKVGTYTVTAEIHGAASSSATVYITDLDSRYEAVLKFMALTVTIDSGSVVTVTDGNSTLTETSTGTAVFYLPSAGTWTVSAALEDDTVSEEITISGYENYEVELIYKKVFGVVWSYGDISTALRRITRANDPHGYVTVDITQEPIAAVGVEGGRSPFDSYMPWCGMQEYNIIGNAVAYKQGEEGFSRSLYDTMVKIPAFYFKIMDDPQSEMRYFYVADKEVAGFTLHPGSGRYVGKYNTGSDFVSKSGLEPLTGSTRSAIRTNVRAKGTDWWKYDIATHNAVQLLYLVEFANWDSQEKIGLGYVNSTKVQTNGGTDSLAYHTGRAAGINGETAVQYRWMENLWGNVSEWLDGISSYGRTVYVCTDPKDYADRYYSDPLDWTFDNNITGFISKLLYVEQYPWLLFASEATGNQNTYIPDRFALHTTIDSQNYGISSGGAYNSNLMAGLFHSGSAASSGSSIVGSRLIFGPAEEAE